VPGQAESWWGYEAAMKQLQNEFQVFAVDLRGQGRSSRTPGRYTLDNWGNDLVRFIQLVVGRPIIVAGNSSGGVLAAWLSAYAPPGLVRAVYLEDPPIFSSELTPACGQSIRQLGVGKLFQLFATYLGNQWSIGDWEGVRTAARAVLPAWIQPWVPNTNEPPQNLKEYDPEWSQAFYSGSASANCRHEDMLKAVKTPVLFSHHFRGSDEKDGTLQGASSDLQADYTRALLDGTGQRLKFLDLPDKAHALHAEEPELYVKLLTEWVAGLQP
jgi:pimeloyl-ACP methyl ester carboxylesterase